MSHHHHHDVEAETPDRHTDDNRSGRRHSHTHLHLKPTMVFDHIKTKVKRKGRSSNPLTEAPAFITTSSLSKTSVSKRSSEESDELEVKQTVTGSHSQLIISSRNTSDQSLQDTNKNKMNNSSIDKLQNSAAVLVDQIEEETKVTEPVQWQLNPVEHGIDNNPKSTKSKSKSRKATKTNSELTHHSTSKTRRQTGRHTSFQIHDEDFHHIFTDLPTDEQLIVAYPCAWRKEIFMHGRMFLSVNYLCFYTCFFKWEESVCIAYKDIVSVRREKSAKVIPNAIQVRTKNRDQYLFASYIPRERIFIAIYRLWQNVLSEKSLDPQQLKKIVYADQISLHDSTGDSEESAILDNHDEHLLNTISDRTKEPSKSSVQADEKMVSSTPAEPTTYLSSCPCETHPARMYAEQGFSYTVEQLFELILGENSFTRASREAQKLTDFTTTKWRKNNETGKRERQVTYKTLTQSILGSNTISCTEKQIIEMENPHLLYVVNTEVYNEGVKYTDAFFVATRFCIFQRDAKHSFLRLSAEVRYIKNVNAIAKAFIEKNCHSNIEESVNNQIRRLENHQTAVNNSQSDRHKKHRRKIRENRERPVEKKTDSTIANAASSDNPTPIREKTITGKGFYFDIALFIGVFLLLIHIYLCYKLSALDQALHASDSTCLNQCGKACLSDKHHH